MKSLRYIYVTSCASCTMCMPRACARKVSIIGLCQNDTYAEEQCSVTGTRK